MSARVLFFVTVLFTLPNYREGPLSCQLTEAEIRGVAATINEFAIFPKIMLIFYLRPIKKFLRCEDA